MLSPPTPRTIQLVTNSNGRGCGFSAGSNTLGSSQRAVHQDHVHAYRASRDGSDAALLIPRSSPLRRYATAYDIPVVCVLAAVGLDVQIRSSGSVQAKYVWSNAIDHECQRQEAHL